MASFATGLVLLALSAPSVFAAGSLKDLNHVVLFMQENRAFDHYFGTMAGVRGFKDPNVQVNPGSKRSIFYQNTLSKKSDHLLPFYLNYLGGDYPEATQCIVAGDNGYTDNHAALNKDLNTNWPVNNTPWSWAHFKRKDLPIHFAIADGWTIGDMYQESVISSTNPNRVSWISGSINVPGGPQTPSEGGVYLDNNESPGCEGPHLNCYPLQWKTYPEYLQEAGISWQVYQDHNNFDDNPLAWFKQFHHLKTGTPLQKRGLAFLGLDQFYADCAAGNLPAVSYIVGPAELSEHPPYQPKDGAWLQRQIIEAFTKSKSYKDSALLVSYDETGGWGDHVTPYHSPPGTAGEWLQDPYKTFGQVYSGPGFRVPFYIVSPWTRGGHVYTANADHISQIKFLETWLAAKGHNVTTSQIPSWRRKHMSDLTQAFDFSAHDLSLPTIPPAQTPSRNKKGHYNGYATCYASYPSTRPMVPYGKQTAKDSLATEQGFKSVRGALTEGRFLTFEMRGRALVNKGGAKLVTGPAAAKHAAKTHRFVVHQLQAGGKSFQISSAVDGRWVTGMGGLVASQSKAGTFVVQDLGNGRGHSVQNAATGRYLGIASAGGVEEGAKVEGFRLFSVTYDD